LNAEITAVDQQGVIRLPQRRGQLIHQPGIHTRENLFGLLADARRLERRHEKPSDRSKRLCRIDLHRGRR
jgi:hypothetical protein